MRRSASALAVAAVAATAVAALAGAATPGPPAGAELAALAAPPARTSIASQRIYFVMPDRYANGDRGNDRGGRAGPAGVTGYDPADTGFFHGGDLKGLTGDCDGPRGLRRLKDLGFTAVWVTPPYGQRAVQGGSAAYHGYWITDFTSVDPHLGTNADFAAFASCAHRLGLKVYLDVVVNHTADVIGLTGSGYSDAPYRDCRGRRFDPARYVAARRFPCLRASSFPRVPVLLPGDRRAKRPLWLNDPLRYHNRGDIQWDSCSEACYEQGDFYGLDDLFTEQPAVVRGLADVYADWIRRYRIDGFRIDTARHVNRAFFRLWLPRIRAAARAAGVEDFEVFGEAFLGDAVELSAFVRDRALPNVLDFPLQDAATRFAAGEAGAKGIAARLDDDDYFRTAAPLAPTPPTFLGNHDIGRGAMVIRSRSGARGDELLARVLLGHDLLYLLRGAPVVYYGDEIGMIGSGGDKAARQDMFPTAVPDWRTEERLGTPPIGRRSSFDVVDHPLAQRLTRLAAIRDAHPALAVGPTAVRAAQGGLLVVSRFDVAARREYLVALNAGEAPARATVATATPSAAWMPLLGDARVASGADGRLTLAVPPLTTLLLRAANDVAVAPTASPALSAGDDDLTDLRRLAAAVPGAAPVSVAFAVRRASGAWRRVAVDDTPPYRAFLDPRAFRRGETVHVVAVARGLDGSTAPSRVVAFRPRP